MLIGRICQGVHVSTMFHKKESISIFPTEKYIMMMAFVPWKIN
jgi:hypothetical protein